jgi:hypothetical protein
VSVALGSSARGDADELRELLVEAVVKADIVDAVLRHVLTSIFEPSASARPTPVT